MNADNEPTVIAEPTTAAPLSPPEPSGSSWIADSIVAKVAASAAREVDGVEDLRSGSARRGWVRGADRRRGGASVRVEDGAAAIEVRLVVRTGVAIPDIVDQVRARIIDRVEFSTGMTVTKVDVGVVDVIPTPVGPAPAETEDLPAAQTPPG